MEARRSRALSERLLDGLKGTIVRIAVIGTGYVGLVASTCFADTGHSVIGVDKDIETVEGLTQGELPIYEPGLAELIARNIRIGRLRFTTDVDVAVRESELIFIAVGTPPMDDGSVDLGSVMKVARQIARSMTEYKVVIMKSTVPVGTGELITDTIRGITSQDFGYVSNPEFLKEGAAVEDFTKPARVVLGSQTQKAIEKVKRAYSPFMRRSERFLVMDTASAELTKYAANAMLALRISFMNEIAGLCEALGADVGDVRRGIGTDPRIGSSFLFPGVGYGGFCLPKDVRALAGMGTGRGLDMQITKAIHSVNIAQRERFAARILDHFDKPVSGTTLSVWGLAYKASTDDVRGSPAIWCIRKFLDKGMNIRAHDPEAMPKAREQLGDSVLMIDDMYEALDGADALVIFTDWHEFRGAELRQVAERLSGNVVFDGRNLYDARYMTELGLKYISIGRPHRPAV